MGETQAMNQVAQIQLSRRGWGRVEPNAVQARRWLEFSSGRGDAVAHTSLMNLDTIMAAREHELAVARQYGLIDYNKVDASGRVISPSEQVKLPPLSFSRIVSHNPTNILEATSEEETLNQFIRGRYQPLAQTLKEHREKLIAEGKPVKQPTGPKPSNPLDYHKIEQQRKAAEAQGLKDISGKVQEQLRQRVASGKISPEDAAKHIKQLQSGEAALESKANQRTARANPSQTQEPQRR